MYLSVLSHINQWDHRCFTLTLTGLQTAIFFSCRCNKNFLPFLLHMKNIKRKTEWNRFMFELQFQLASSEQIYSWPILTVHHCKLGGPVRKHLNLPALLKTSLWDLVRRFQIWILCYKPYQIKRGWRGNQDKYCAMNEQVVEGFLVNKSPTFTMDLM